MFNAKTLLLFALQHEIFVSRQSDYEKFKKWCYFLKCMILCLLYNFCFSFDFKEMYGQHIKYSGEGGGGGWGIIGVKFCRLDLSC